ncbi:MAG: hypothetical protein R2751_12665 [Bacteroidales bacterium]
MKEFLWRGRAAIRHAAHIKHRHGRFLHSPFLFDLVHRTVFNTAGLQVPEEIVRTHRELKGSGDPMKPGEWGAGTGQSAPAVPTVGSFVRRASVPERYGALLYRLSNWFGPDVLLELGTGLGVSGMYLASGSPGTALHTMEGDSDRAHFAETLFKRLGQTGVKVHIGDLGLSLDRILPEVPKKFLAFVDGNHACEPTVAYVRKLVDASQGRGMVVLDDVYWSKGMARAWKEIIAWPEVPVAIDLHRMGILVLRNDLTPRNLKILF